MKSIRIIMTSMICMGLLISCGPSLQEKINNAEGSVNDAKRINANKYATKEIQEATKALNDAKVALASGQKKQANEKVIIAEKKADKAYYKSINKFVQSENKLIKTRMDAAKNSGADILVPDKYNEAKKLADQIGKDTKRVNELQLKLQKMEKKKKA